MKRNVIYFVDEDPAARLANARELIALIDNAEIKVVAQEPYKKFSDYDAILTDPTTAAFILDQRMKGSGKVSYNGTDLAAYLRRFETKMPIYILTGHADAVEDFEGCKHLVEYILEKEDIERVDSAEAKVIKARLLRHLEVFNDVRDEPEQRFHELLVKSLQETLSLEEQAEMKKVEGETTAPILLAEHARERSLAASIEELRTLFRSNQLPL